MKHPMSYYGYYVVGGIFVGIMAFAIVHLVELWLVVSSM